jgi:Protein of unknown function DUF262
MATPILWATRTRVDLSRGRIGAIGVSESPEEEIAVEYDAKGRSTGVEFEEQPDDLINEPFDPALIDVQTRIMTVDLLLARLRRGVLDLAPDFQRNAGIWSSEAQSRLIESLLLRIPLPTLYAAESGEESWAIVDGIQRLTTIARFVDPDEPLKLSGLEYLPYDGYEYKDLPGGLQTRINETELIIHLIRTGTPEPVKFNIFVRINTGGRPLTSQELRHALIPGKARDLLRDLAESSTFRSATRNSVKPDRMADREMVLRFLAFRLTDPSAYKRGDLDAFLRQAMERLNASSDAEIQRLTGEFHRSMTAASFIFEEHAFRKRFHRQMGRLPINKALFETISVNLAEIGTNGLEQLFDGKSMVQDGIADLMDHGRFHQAISVGTGDVEKVRYRFAAVEALFRRVIG